MQVIKFGGTSVGSVEALENVLKIVKQKKQSQTPLVVVCSAFSKVTDLLINAAVLAAKKDDSYTEILAQIKERHLSVIAHFLVKNKTICTTETNALLDELTEITKGIFLLKQLPLQAKDLVISFGERLSNTIVSAILNENNIAARYTDASKLIVTDSKFGNARFLKKESYASIQNYFSALDKNEVAVVTGFIGNDKEGNITTLGRGGSDLTASILGAALQSDVIEIWTDVDGMLTADPRKVKSTFPIPQLSYKEAMELSHFGAKVIYPPSLQPAMAEGIPIIIKNTFNYNHAGSLITQTSPPSVNIIRGISSISQIALIRIEGAALMGAVGMMGRVSKALASHQINIVFLTQGSSEYSICLGIMPTDIEAAKTALSAEFEYELSQETLLPFDFDAEKTLIAVIGENMRHAPGVAAKVFKALGKNGINIAAIAQGSSELNISIIIDSPHETKALNALHEIFFAEDIFQLNVFLVGHSGLIGKTLLQQIAQQQSFLKQEKNIQLNIAGAINSKKMLLDSNGIDTAQLGETVDTKGATSDVTYFIAQIKEMDLPNSILVDCSANTTFVEHYEDILLHSISIVTPNKIANSLAQEKYDALRKAAIKGNAKFYYETNVGAGLPVISTLHNLLNSGDKILKIEAILSGTLSFIFNNFSDEKTFTAIVKEAQEKGFTEPDPRDDLSGLDVARKCLILARECGLSLEIEDIVVENLVPEKCRTAATVAEFYELLPSNEQAIITKKNTALQSGNRLRYIAVIENNTAKVALKEVDSHHPFFALSGSDNMIVFTTERYKQNPLVVRGPGAGAAVTAAGVFAEIIALGSYMHD